MTDAPAEAVETKCGNCRHFQTRETVTNAMRMFGPEKTEPRTYCMWKPPVPSWVKLEYLPTNMTETGARSRGPEEGRFCAAFAPSQAERA